MKITPLEIKNQEFKKVFRGYDADEVSTFLEMLSDEMENITREQKENREKILELETQLKDYRLLEKSLQQALLQAQESTTKAQERAEKEAELIRKKAEAQAVEILQGAKDELGKLSGEIDRLHTIRETMVSRIRLLLYSQIELLRSMESESETGNKEELTVQVGDKVKNVDDVVEDLDKES